jgi:phage tail sheath gpL-like
MSKSAAFPEVSAAQHAFNAGWASALDYTNQPYPSQQVLAQAYARYVASVLMFSPEPETKEQS